MSILSSKAKVAVVPGNRLGDSLLFSVLTYNLKKNGYYATTFSNILLQMQSWFPNTNLHPLPGVEEGKNTFQPYDLIIHQHPNHLSKQPSCPHQTVEVLYGTRFYMQRKSLIDVYMDVCRQTLELPQLDRSNGIVIPKNLTFRKVNKRIILHPTSLRKEKNWPAEKFTALAKSLKDMGYQPIFIVSPEEKPSWNWLIDQGFELSIFASLSDLAAFIYESGYMIGNDSGIAHLASNVGIPTVSLFIRPGVARRWRPNFYAGKVILPGLHLPGRKLKERYWKRLVSVSKVLTNFKRLVKETEKLSG